LVYSYSEKWITAFRQILFEKLSFTPIILEGKKYGEKKTLQNKTVRLSVMEHTCNPRTWQAEAEGSWVQGQPSETLCQKTKQNTDYLA
jgi:hypothetical protein